MIHILGGDKFLSALLGRYLVYFSGGLGTGKTSMAVALSGMLHEWGLVDATISNLPIAWAVPAKEAPLERVCIVIDELGTFFHARDFGDRKSNGFVKSLLGFPRKVGSYVIVASRLNVDVTFRALSVQREYDLGPLQIFAFAEDDGQQQAVGRFGVWGLSSLYQSPLIPMPEAFPRGYLSSYFATRYIPSGIQFLAGWVDRAVAAAKDESEFDPNEIRAVGDEAEIFSSLATVRPEESPPVPVPTSDASGNAGSQVILPSWAALGVNVQTDMDTNPLRRRI